jgi:hypothetical protein
MLCSITDHSNNGRIGADKQANYIAATEVFDVLNLFETVGLVLEKLYLHHKYKPKNSVLVATDSSCKTFPSSCAKDQG